jgi:hypothetical protein
MEVSTRPSIYAVPGIPFCVKNAKKVPLLTAIAFEWKVPEDQILGITEVIDVKHNSPKSNPGLRIKQKGERKPNIANARKFYFYIMIIVKEYAWKDMTALTGRKIAAMKWCCEKAQHHIDNEKDFRDRALAILELIKDDKIIFPTPPPLKKGQYAKTT